MSAIAERVTPNGTAPGKHARRRRWRRDWMGYGDDDKDNDADNADSEALAREVAALRERVETLEAIVTDRKFQWEQDLNRRS